jgi:hypothetical protein
MLGEPERRYVNWLLQKATKNGDCLECHFVPISAGYSYVRHEGKRVRAHRFVWQTLNYEIESDVFVLHRCDNPRCINPAHLFIGSAADNTEDMLKKGRHTYKHFDTRKVTPEVQEEMKALRAKGYSAPYIANKFKLSAGTVYDYTSKGGRKYE